MQSLCLLSSSGRREGTSQDTTGFLSAIIRSRNPTSSGGLSSSKKSKYSLSDFKNSFINSFRAEAIHTRLVWQIVSLWLVVLRRAYKKAHILTSILPRVGIAMNTFIKNDYWIVSIFPVIRLKKVLVFVTGLFAILASTNARQEARASIISSCFPFGNFSNSSSSSCILLSCRTI